MTADTFWELFRRTVISSPDTAAIIDTRRDRRLDYSAFHDHICGLVGALAERGVGYGDTYATVCKNGLEQTAAIIGASALGATVNTVNYRQSPDAITHMVTDSDTKAVIFDEDNREKVASIREDLDTVDSYMYAGDKPPDWADAYTTAVETHRGETPPTPDLSPDDGVFLVYTSGTTGSPKGCLWTNDRLVETLLQILAEFRIDEERALLVVPEAHAAGGFGGGIAPLYRGGTVITLPDFHPVRALEWIERESVTYLLALPAMLRALMGVDVEQFDTDSLEKIVSIGSPLPADLARSVDTRFDLNYFGNHMGSTEGGWFLTRDVRDDFDAVSSPGTAALNVETRVVTFEEGETGDPDDLCDTNETGELIVNSPYQMDRYLNRPEETAESFRDDWYYTGDLGYVDTQGRFWPEGRKTNMIISGGINVSDVNVERVLTDHPAIETVAVVGIPDEEWGERVVACVTTDDETAIGEDDILEWCKDRSDLADFQVPKEIKFVDKFPRSATGKVQKFKLEEILAQGTV